MLLSSGDEKEKLVTGGGPDLSEGLESAQSLLPLLIHPLLPLLLLLFSFLTFLQQTTGGDSEWETSETRSAPKCDSASTFSKRPLWAVSRCHEVVPGGPGDAG